MIVISEKDRSLLPGAKKQTMVVGNGVNIPGRYQVTTKKFDILFLGNFSYMPNLNAARFLITRIHPKLYESFPEIRILLAGIDAEKQLNKFRVKNVEVRSNVKSIIPLFGSSRIFVAPMFMSTGIQNKILEAMANGIPVITTPNAADAIGAKDCKHLLLAISEQEFHDQILRLLIDQVLSENLVRNAYQLISENYDWKKTLS